MSDTNINNENDKNQIIDGEEETKKVQSADEDKKDVVVSKEDLTEYIEKIQKDAKISGRFQGAVFALLIVFILSISVVSFTIFINRFSLSGANDKIINKEVEEKVQHLYSAMNKYFLWDVDEEKIRDNVYKGIFEGLDDPYSVYYTKEEYADLMETSSGQYSGIGAYIGQKTDSKVLYISRPMPGSPAEKAGILTDDVIVEVDGENIEGQDINVVVSKIKGKKGTTVDIGVKREGESDIITISVVRDTIEVEMLESEMLDDNVGYILIYSFEQPTYSQFVSEYQKLKEQGMKSLIIDLRDNPGGDLDIVTKLADFILPEGTIVYTKNKNGRGEKYTSDKKCIDIPLVVLINNNSASASEILAGSIKDYEYGTLVGEKTFGKGIVQVVLGMRDGSGFKITESEYYLPNDECIHNVGIEPDVKIELDVEKFKKEKYDNQKIKAWEIAKEKQKADSVEEPSEDTEKSTK